VTGVVLVVDDSDSMLEVVRDALEAEGLEVATETTSVQVVPRVEAERPAVLVLDVLMPGMTAVEVMSELARAEYRPPVILHTGSLLSEVPITPSGDTFLAQMYRLGVVAVCLKGQDLACLISEVKRALGPGGTDDADL